MPDLRLYKSEKLCGVTAVSRLFAGSAATAKAYPLRAVYAFTSHSDTDKSHARFMITVPKKKIRKAVGRVLLRRRIREAYRLNRRLLVPALSAAGKNAEIAFVYLADTAKDYSVISLQMQSLLQKIADAASASGANGEEGQC